MKLADLDVVGADPPLAAGERLDALDPEHVRLDPLDVRAERDEEAAEILDVRLAGGVADHRLAGREHGGHDRVLGRHHARLVEEDVLAAQAVRRRASRSASLERRSRRPSGRTRGCAGRAGGARSRRRRAAARHAAEAREQRAGEQERGAHAPAELRVELGLGRLRPCRRAPRSRRSTSTSAPMSASSSSIVSTSRIRGTFESVTGSPASTRRGEDRQRAVLVSRPPDRPGEALAALDHEGFHQLGAE